MPNCPLCQGGSNIAEFLITFLMTDCEASGKNASEGVKMRRVSIITMQWYSWQVFLTVSQISSGPEKKSKVNFTFIKENMNVNIATALVNFLSR